MAGPVRGRAVFALALLLGAAGTAAVHAENALLISAASSLGPVLTGLVPRMEAVVGATVRVNAAASGTLRTQIEAGAPVDLYLSADPADLDRLAARGFLRPGSRRDLLATTLVLIGAKGGARPGGSEASGAPGEARARAALEKAPLLAIGLPAGVPAGRYALEALAWLGGAPRPAGSFVHAGSVREVLEFVRRGAAPLGFVFAPDAREPVLRGEVELLWEVPAAAFVSAPRYVAGIPMTAKVPELAARLEAWLLGEEARRAFLDAGFTLP